MVLPMPSDLSGITGFGKNELWLVEAFRSMDSQACVVASCTSYII